MMQRDEMRKRPSREYFYHYSEYSGVHFTKFSITIAIYHINSVVSRFNIVVPAFPHDIFRV